MDPCHEKSVNSVKNLINFRRKEVEKGWDSSPERKKKIELKLKKERASSSDRYVFQSQKTIFF